MTSQPVLNNPNILTLENWQFHIDKKKLELLTHISSSNYLENTSENLQFISIIKELVNCNLFNILNIAFYILKLLENTFIDSDIICEVISDTNINTQNKDIKHTPTSDAYLNTLKKFLHLIIDNIVYIELSLNIHFIIIINNLQKLRQSKDNKYVSPKVFHTFEKINNDIINTIKPSSHILLFLKLIRKLGNFHINSLNNNDIFTNKNSNTDSTNKISKTIDYTNYIKKNKESSNKIKCTLDNFIININNFYESKDYKDKDIIIKCPLNTTLNVIHSVNNNITSICQNYIILVVKILFTEFNNLFDLLATHLKSSDNITEEKIQNILIIKTTLSNMINIEIENIKNKLLFDK